ncbi:MAG: ComEC/Rec2 family competence protein [Clostridiales bacterium]|jgi:competence protein ComEC|nr:ComEC/Rec2 family competence protein [Clostridiales bacterium]
MKRPLLIGYVLLISAIAAGIYSGPFVVLSGLLCVLALSLILSIKLKYKGYMAFIFFYILGAVLGSNVGNVEKGPCLILGKDVSVSGLVVDTSLTGTGKQKLVLKAEHYTYADSEYDWPEKVQIVLGEGEFVNPGDIISVSGIVNHTETARNPGAYNEYMNLGSEKIYHKMYGALNTVYPPVLNAYTVSNTLKNKIAAVYDTHLPKKEASILKSMILGDTSDLDEDIEGLYKTAGIYHILVVSGLHISAIAMFLNSILNRFLGPKQAGVVVVLALFAYCFLTGFGVSSARSLIMCICLILSGIIYRKADVITSAAFAGGVLAVYNPLYLFNIGYQYSFMAIFGIGFLADVIGDIIVNITGLKAYWPVYSVKLYSSSLAVTIFTLPVCLYHFNYISLYSSVVNMFVIPTVFIVMLCGFIMAAVGLVFTLWVGVLAAPVYFLLKFYEMLCLGAEKLPFSILYSATPHVLICVGYIAAVLLVIYFVKRYLKEVSKPEGIFRAGDSEDDVFIAPALEDDQNDILERFQDARPSPVYLQRFLEYCTYTIKGQGSGKKEKQLFPAFVTIAVFAVIVFAYGTIEEPFTITMLDVGQGDCAVIENGEETYIMDGGGWYNREIGENTGTSVIEPYLRYKGINKVDGVFISHLDFDHAFGIIELLGIMDVENVYLASVYDETNPLYAQLIEAADLHGCKISYLNKGDMVRSVGGIRFLVLSPDKDGHYDNENDKSLVVYMKNDVSAVFAGDIGFDIEDDIVRNWGNLTADILKVSHHGSKNATGAEFLESIKPHLAIGGVGVNNSYSFPGVETVERLHKAGAVTYFTNTAGAVIITYTSTGIEVKTMLE